MERRTGKHGYGQTEMELSFRRKDIEFVDGSKFPWIRGREECPVIVENIGGRTVRIIDISGTHPVLFALNRRLNGSTSRAESLVRTSIAKSLINHGIVPGAQVLREKMRRGVSMLGVQSTDPNEKTRVSAVITPVDEAGNAYVVSRSMYQDSSRVIAALEATGYVSSGRGN